ncbi:MAG: hypothetical protein A7316_08625 [Candidatus Altiarchaeales archaeon WOR_SM1_86-2]|nr:MAG: hypothetical protein A7316_08625 [Candidatus Altiarchaeales archaeon WOR_SM1_86-2]
MQELITLPNINTQQTENRITINHIFTHNSNWEVYKHKHLDELREVEIKEIEKMLQCQNNPRGYFVYACPNCGEVKIIHFGCNSRICTHCGKKYADKWAENLAKNTFDVPHRHCVMTIAEQLRPIFKEYRECLLKILMDCAITAISDMMEWKLGREVTPGVVVVIHTYGKDMKFNPHIHALVTEGGFKENSAWVSVNKFPYKMLRKAWQYQILTRVKEVIPDTSENRRLIDFLFKNYPEGFYVRAKDSIKSKRKLSAYIGRYIRHPAVAECRITNYDGKTVTFYYDEKNEKGEVIKRHYVTMSVEEFISALIGHIPDTQFKTVRYYGVYYRVKKNHFNQLIRRSLCLGSITQEKLTKWTGKWAPDCPRCGCKMQLAWVDYGEPPPNHIFGTKIEDWHWIGRDFGRA